MISLNELCDLAGPLDTTNAPLRQACASPRSPVDMDPLPEPHLDVAFDSSWDVLLTGTDVYVGGNHEHNLKSDRRSHR